MNTKITLNSRPCCLELKYLELHVIKKNYLIIQKCL